MSRSEVYESLKRWLDAHGFTAGYQVQKRFWQDADSGTRFIVIQQNTGGDSEEAVLRDSFRLLFITAKSDPDIDSVEDLADTVRRTLIADYCAGSIFAMQPTGGVQQYKTTENRIIFEINFNALIST